MNNNNDDDDPFSHFEDDDIAKNDATTTPSSKFTRDPSCGVCAFHPNTESSLLIHVRNALSSSKQNQSSLASSPAERILSSVDDYCRTRHWMMHLGPEKRRLLQSTLWDSLLRTTTHRGDDTFAVVELGSYCGYSAVVIASCLREAMMQNPNIVDAKKFHLYSFDVSPAYLSIAKEMIRLAGLEDLVTFLLLQKNEIAAERLSSSRYVDTVRLLLFDHDKMRYLKDLRSFESRKLLRANSVVVADNVIFAEIDDYREYVKELERRNIVETRTVDCMVEYSEGVKDGIGT